MLEVCCYCRQGCEPNAMATVVAFANAAAAPDAAASKHTAAAAAASILKPPSLPDPVTHHPATLACLSVPPDTVTSPCRFSPPPSPPKVTLRV